MARTKIATNFFSMARVLSVATKMGKVLWLASNYWLRSGNVILFRGENLVVLSLLYDTTCHWIANANSVFNNATYFSSSASFFFPIQLPFLNKKCWKENLKPKLSNRQRSILFIATKRTQDKYNCNWFIFYGQNYLMLFLVGISWKNSVTK